MWDGDGVKPYFDKICIKVGGFLCWKTIEVSRKRLCSCTTSSSLSESPLPHSKLNLTPTNQIPPETCRGPRSRRVHDVPAGGGGLESFSSSSSPLSCLSLTSFSSRLFSPAEQNSDFFFFFSSSFIIFVSPLLLLLRHPPPHTSVAFRWVDTMSWVSSTIFFALPPAPPPPPPPTGWMLSSRPLLPLSPPLRHLKTARKAAR